VTPAEGEGECTLCHAPAPHTELTEIPTRVGPQPVCARCLRAADNTVAIMASVLGRLLRVRLVSN